MTTLTQTLTVAALIGSGLIAGLFFTFSTFVMQALAKLPAPSGIEAMQWINKTVMNPVTMGVFMGTAALGLALVALGVWRWGQPGSAWLIAGGLLYVLGGFGVTAIGNVPMNDKLAAMSATDPQTFEYWAHYLTRWTAWNTFRTVNTTLACLALAIALLVARVD
ncbi:MAG: anthrone oxygenase family protein [Planctomycetota bacterium]